MPNLRSQPVQGGPTQPVYIMNGVPGSQGAGGGFGSGLAVASGTKSAAGNNTLIAAPATGYRIVVYTAIIQNESSTLTTVAMKDIVERWRAILPNQGDKMVLAFELSVPWTLNEATALTLYLSAANSHNYNVQYSIEPV
jgi:hypothetical protein